jgi:hypothetical protein
MENGQNLSRFETGVERCRTKYKVVCMLRQRTHNALYEAVGELYGLSWKIKSDLRLKREFEEKLSQRGKRQRRNPTLFLVKYTFFPESLEFGAGNKAANNQASRIAKMINLVSRQRVAPPDFAQEARRIWVQREVTRAGRTRSATRGKSEFAPANSQLGKRMPSHPLPTQRLRPTPTRRMSGLTGSTPLRKDLIIKPKC